MSEPELRIQIEVHPAELAGNADAYNTIADALREEGWEVEIHRRTSTDGIERRDHFGGDIVRILDDAGRIKIVLEVAAYVTRGAVVKRAQEIAAIVRGRLGRARRRPYTRSVTIHDDRGNVLLQVDVPEEPAE